MIKLFEELLENYLTQLYITILHYKMRGAPSFHLNVKYLYVDIQHSYLKKKILKMIQKYYGIMFPEI